VKYKNCPIGGIDLKLRTLIFLGPLVFLIHDLEEVFTVEQWVKGHESTLQKITLAKVLFKSNGYTTIEFAVTVTFLFLMFVLISSSASKKIGWGMKCYLAAIFILFVNVFTHLAQTFFLQMYTPGVITALVVVLPYTVFVIVAVKRSQILNSRVFLQSMGIGVLFLPVIFAAMLIVHQLFI